MPMTIFCPTCRASLQVGDDVAGTHVTCPRCADVALVPRITPLAAAMDATTPGQSSEGYRKLRAADGLNSD